MPLTGSVTQLGKNDSNNNKTVTALSIVTTFDTPRSTLFLRHQPTV